MRYAGIVQMLGVPHSALISITFGMMLASFPLGAYVVFHADVGGHITYRMPVSQLGAVDAAPVPLPQAELGDVFAAAWCAYAALFALAMLGPRRNIMSALRDSLYGNGASSNYLVQAIAWFGVLVMASAAIDALQGQLDISMAPPHADNDLVQFYMITLSPLVEEPVFRVLLVGLPVFAVYAHRMSPALLARALWHPSRYLHLYETKKMWAVVIVAGVAFGTAHVLSAESWGTGKLAQATVAGLILGYAYCRYGLVCCIVLHWAANYFLYAYGNFVAHVGDWSVLDAFGQPFFGTVQAILVALGAVTVAAGLARRIIPERP